MTQLFHSWDTDQTHSHLGVLGTCTQIAFGYVHSGHYGSGLLEES